MQAVKKTQERAESAWRQKRESHSDDRRRLERQSMRNWYLLAGICALSTLGLLIAVTPNLQGPLRDYWPAARTDIVLLAGLGGTILLLVLHLTTQQQRVTRMRHHVQSMESVESERRKQNAIRLHALLNVTRMMGAVSEPMKLFQGITTTCLEVFECQQASLMLVSGDGKHLEMKAASGHKDIAAVRGASQPVGRGIAGYVAQNREPLLLGPDIDPADFPGLQADNRGLHAAMVMPIIVRDELVGVLSISSRSKTTTYSEEDLQALEVFAINAGNCIHQAERTEWMRQTIEHYRERDATAETSPQA